jgi:hypothetical protein
MASITILIFCFFIGIPILFTGIILFIFSQKEGLGILYKIVSYLAIICGTIIFLGGVFFSSSVNDLLLN